MGHDSLENHLKTNFNLRSMGWSFTEIDDMVPWERTLYLDLMRQKIHNEAERERDLQLTRR
jgi:hypothetical protein